MNSQEIHELANVKTVPAAHRDGIERCQIFGDMPGNMAGDVVSIRGAVYVIDGFGESWEQHGVTLRYVYLRPSDDLTPEAAALVAALESAGLTRTEVRWSPLVALAGIINGVDVLVTIQRGTFSRDGEMVAEVFEKDGKAWGECGFYQLTDTAGVFGMISEITGISIQDTEKAMDCKKDDWSTLPIWNAAQEYTCKETGSSIHRFISGERAESPEKAADKLIKSAMLSNMGAEVEIERISDREVRVTADIGQDVITYVLRAHHPDSEKAPRNRATDFMNW